MEPFRQPVPERKIPKDLAKSGELSMFLSEHKIKIFSRENYSKYEIINFHVEQNKGDTPFFIVDLGEILEQYKQWKAHLPRVRPLFAVKCCPNPMVLKFLSVLGCGFACSSKTELINVKELGVPIDRIVYSNPVKDPQHIKFAKSQDIDTLVVDNEVELFKIKLYHADAKLILRISVEDFDSEHTMNTKFGCSFSQAKSLLQKAKSLDLNVVGVSFHIGSRNSDIEAYTTGVKYAREIFDVAKGYDIDMNLLDIGGGFPGSQKLSFLSFEDISRTVNSAIEKYFGDMENLKVIAEPGRYFTTKSHTLAFNVIGKKKTIDQNAGDVHFEYYMNDGIYGSFNCMLFDGANPQIQPFNCNEDNLYRSTLYGPTCEDRDIITRSAELPELEIGEWCYVEDFGAYTQGSTVECNGFEAPECNYVFLY